jgi:hypothetical protein
MTLTETTVDALIRDMRRFQRAAGAAEALHVSDGSGKCRECRKPWRCPTSAALLTGLHWDGRGDDDAKGEMNDGRP